jgi:hypothetical protein
LRRIKLLLKTILRRSVNKLIGHTVDYSFLRDARNIEEWRQKNALTETGQFVEQFMPFAPSFSTPEELMAHAVSHVKPEAKGLVCEFGVATGKTINHIASLLPQMTIYGFDSFEGLPERWQAHYPKGSFKMEQLPKVRANVRLKKGWFSETLPDFLQEHAGAGLFLHIDCDLYSSTVEVFEHLEPRISAGTIIVFDEYFNYPGWKERTGHGHEYLGYAKSNEQVAVRITSEKRVEKGALATEGTARPEI